ncbi:MAG: hypothetical protein ACRDGM_19020 [bacterium]
MAYKSPIHARDHHPFGQDPIKWRTYHIKVISDTRTFTTGDGKFIWSVPRDVGGLKLIEVAISVTTISSSGIVQVQIRNITRTADMLSTRVQVDANQFHSKDAATQPVVDTANNDVAHGDRIAIDVDAAGTGAKGLEVVLTFA